MFCGRVGAQLTVTRAIGDHNLKRDGVIAKPTIRRLLVKPTNKWLIIATDGVWDWFEEKDLLGITNKEDTTAKNVAQEIVKKSLEQGSKDNITCLVIKL
jgi:serine/threonine protein phosphatase PrpC